MSNHLEDIIAQGGLLPRAGKLTVALSGGADSVALLLLLQELQPQFGYDLQAIHIHHGIRGAEADRDAIFCEALCKNRQIPFFCHYVDVPAFAAAQKLSIETAARILRYEALQRFAPTGWIATAHHADDEAETMLFHLMRGCGLNGLCGIPPKRGRIIRPLLGISKDELLAYLQTQGQDFVTDSSNLTEDAARNRLRHRILPVLREYQPTLISHLTCTAQTLREDEAYLTAQANRVFAQSFHEQWGGLQHLAEQPRPLRIRCYRMLLAHYQIDPSYPLLCAMDRLVQENMGKITVSGDVYAQVHRGMLFVMRDARPLCNAMPLHIGENRQFAERICIASLENAALSPKIHKSFTQYALDYDKIIGKPCFRLRQRDDRIVLPGQKHSIALRKAVQAKIPLPLRQSIYALYDDTGCIFCEGVGVAAGVAPKTISKRLLLLQCTTVSPTEIQ